MSVRLGRMCWRVTIEQPPSPQQRNTMGEPVSETVQPWTTFWTCWAAVDVLSGREIYREAQVQPDATHKVTIRFKAGITPQMRVIHRGRTLNIYRVDDPDSEKDEKLELYCIEAK